jgi:hypothetical protein
MESKIDESKDENIIITRNCVDHYLIKYGLKFSQIERDDIIILVFKIIQKQYIAPEHSRFEANKQAIICTVVKSYLGSVKLGKPNLH